MYKTYLATEKASPPNSNGISRLIEVNRSASVRVNLTEVEERTVIHSEELLSMCEEAIQLIAPNPGTILTLARIHKLVRQIREGK